MTVGAPSWAIFTSRTKSPFVRQVPCLLDNRPPSTNGTALQRSGYRSIENARRKQALKRGGDWDRVEVSLNDLPEVGSLVDLLEMDEALTRLAEQDAQAAEMVKLRYFTGLSLTEAAEMMELSESSARRLWLYARSFLLEELSPGQ